MLVKEVGKKRCEIVISIKKKSISKAFSMMIKCALLLYNLMIMKKGIKIDAAVAGTRITNLRIRRVEGLINSIFH